MPIRIRYRYPSHYADRVLSGAALVAFDCEAARGDYDPDRDPIRSLTSDNERMQELLGRLIDQLLIKRALDSSDIRAVFHDLDGDWEVAEGVPVALGDVER